MASSYREMYEVLLMRPPVLLTLLDIGRRSPICYLPVCKELSKSGYVCARKMARRWTRRV
jgi:hypothetical protein